MAIKIVDRSWVGGYLWGVFIPILAFLIQW